MNDYEKALTPSNELNEKHFRDWLRSEIPKEVVHEVGSKTSLNGDSWVAPIWDINKSKLLGYRARYNNEVIATNKYPSNEGKTPKYRPSKGLGNVFFFPHVSGNNWQKISEDTNISTGVTEGEKKAVKVTIEGLPTIGLFGVNNWVCKKENTDNDDGEEKTEPIEDFKLFKWKDRLVYLIFDSDKFKNKRVLEAEGKLWAYLIKLGANCKVINLPEDPEAKGIDDYLVKHGGTSYAQ